MVVHAWALLYCVGCGQALAGKGGWPSDVYADQFSYMTPIGRLQSVKSVYSFQGSPLIGRLFPSHSFWSFDNTSPLARLLPRTIPTGSRSLSDPILPSDTGRSITGKIPFTKAPQTA